MRNFFRSNQESIKSVVSLLLTFFIFLIIIDPFLFSFVYFSLPTYYLVDDFGRIYASSEIIKETKGEKILILGSSITQEGIDCIFIDSETDYECFNLGVSSDIPYLRFYEIPLILEAKPTTVVIEINPLTFSNISLVSDSYIEMRLGLASLYQDPNQKLMWSNHVLPEHKDFVIDNFQDKQNFLNKNINYIYDKKLTHFAMSTLKSEYDLGFIDKKQILKEPYKPEVNKKNNTELLSDLSMFFDDSFFKSEPKLDNLNLLYLELIIDIFLKNQISVIFVSSPFHPLVIDNLPDGHWNNFDTILNYLNTTYNLPIVFELYEIWDEDEFTDLSHTNAQGRIILSNKIIEFL